MTRSRGIAMFCVGILALPAVCAAPPADPAAALAKPIEKAAVQGPLRLALRQVEKLAGVRIEADWRALETVGVKPGDVVAVNAPGATGRQLLELALAQVASEGNPLGFRIDDDVVLVTTQAFVLNKGRAVVRMGARGGVGQAAPARAARTERARGKRLDFENTPLEDVVNFFRESTGLNFYVNWPSLAAVDVQRDAPISLHVRGITLARTLDLVVEQANAGKGTLESVYWVLDEGVITIASGHALNTKLSTQVFEIADLLDVSPRVSKPTFHNANTSSSNSSSTSVNSSGTLFPTDNNTSTTDPNGVNTTNNGDDEQARRDSARDDLIEMIKDSLGPEMWDPDGKGSIRITGSKLIISQTQLGFKLLGEATRRR